MFSPRGGGGGDGWETDEEEEALDPAASRQLTASQVRGKRLMRDAVQVCKETADVLESKADNLRGLYADMSDVVSDSKRITSAYVLVLASVIRSAFSVSVLQVQAAQVASLGFGRRTAAFRCPLSVAFPVLRVSVPDPVAAAHLAGLQ